jgi:Flp pilus assembly protein TadG
VDVIGIKELRGLLSSFNIKQKVKAFMADDSGAIALVITFLLVAFLGMGALGVDYGHMAVVQNDLKKAADAGALAGAAALGSSTPNWSAGETAATNIVKENYADGQKLIDCQTDAGYWNLSTKTFDPNTAKTPSSSEVAAMQVVLAKSLPLSFAPILGINSTDLTGNAVAIINSPGSSEGGWSILETGKGNINLSNNATLNQSVGMNGNGNLTLSNNANIKGGVWDNGSGTLSMSNNATVEGNSYINSDTKVSINNNAEFKNGPPEVNATETGTVQTAAQAAKTASDNFKSLSDNVAGPSSINLSNNQSLTITGTNTVNVLDLSTLSLSNNATLTLNASATDSFIVKVNNLNLSNNTEIILQGGLTYDNVTFVNKGTNAVNISNNAILRGNILSLKGDINLSNNTTYYGSLIGGKNITLSNNVHSPVKISWLPGPGGGSGAGTPGAHLVQ